MKNDTAILVIDDDEQICFALGELFKFQGWKPYSAYDVESGLNEFKVRQPDIVLIDYHLPRINGVEGVKRLRDAGADAVTIADCPIGRPRADSSLLACKLKRELGVEPLPHMTCRDRNLNATKALLLGLSIEGVHNVLLVTGDPIPSEDRDEVKSVFNFNSRRLAAYVSGLNENVLRTPFRIFGALNVNAKNFAAQLSVAREKEACGVSGFLTQPVLSREALENLKLARQTLRGKILGGIYPVVSHKNACFLNNEIAGMRICEEITALYEGRDREEAEARLEQALLFRLEKLMEAGRGEVLRTDFSAREEGGRLTVTLLAECREEIGRTVERPGETGRRPGGAE